MRIKLSFIILQLFAFTLVFGQASSLHYLDPYNPEYVEGEILVKFTDEAELQFSKSAGVVSTGIASLDELFVQNGITEFQKAFKNAQKLAQNKTISYGGTTKEVGQLFNIYKLEFTSTLNAKEIALLLTEDENVDFAEPNYLVYTTETYPDDPMYENGDQWHLNTINAPLAWDLTTSDTSQIIGIIDTGVDWDHPDLDDNIWTNPNEVADNGIDDDGNGYIDDIRGWDFVNDDNNPNDDNSHGTHVAGIAAAESNNGVGVAGVAWNSRIMPIKMLQSSGSGSSSDLALAIDYAAQNGATVINMSLGSYGESYSVKIALENAYATSILVAAAGNDGYKVDPPYPPLPIYAPHYPACYSFVIGVEATTQSNSLAGFSNYDPSGPIVAANSYGHNYEIKAPGVGIYSTFPNGSYSSLNGTSMATPIVAGAVALMKSYDASQSTETLFAKLIQGANNGILDISNSLTIELTPDLFFVEFTLTDTITGDDEDGIADAGETIEIFLTVKNAGAYSDSVWTKLRFAQYEDTTTAIIIDSTSYIGDISTYATLNGDLDPFRIQIDADVVNNRDIVFEYEIGAKDQDSFIGEIIITVQNGFEVGGIISENTTWTNDRTYIVTENLRIASDVTLTIESGTTIRIDPQKSIDIVGSLIANGNEEDGFIIFTRNKIEYGYGLNISYGASSVINISKTIFEYQMNAIVKDDNECIIDVHDCIFRYCNDVLMGGGNSIYTKYYKNNFYYSYVYNAVINSGNIEITSFNHNNIIENTGAGFGDMSTGGIKIFVTYDNMEPVFSNNNLYSNFRTDNIESNSRLYGGGYDYYDISNNYWGTKDSLHIKSTISDFSNDVNLPVAIYYPFLDQPSDSAHGIVWKVEINDIPMNKYDNPYNSPTGLGVVGSETLKFDVLFNRAMDTSITPFLTFGVRDPYTQKVVSDNASWSSDSTMWTAYYTVGLETGDGLQTIRVANAYDNEHFEIPIEKRRFEFVIQAAGAASVNFQATPGIGKVDLEWPFANTDDALGFNMYRFENLTDSTFSDTILINEVLLVDSMYTDFDVIPGETYHYLYKILGTDMEESDYSKSVAATPFDAPTGDANGDLTVNVLDIITVVNYMLEYDPSPFLFDAADVNMDGVINVLDIIGIVNIINGEFDLMINSLTEADFTLENNHLFADASGELGGFQFILKGDIEDINLTSLYPMEMITKQIAEDELLIIVYSFNQNYIPEGYNAVLSFTENNSLAIESLVVSDTKGNNVLASIDGVTNVNEINEEIVDVEQNYPNPFTGITRIPYKLYERGDVSFTVYNTFGQEVYTITRKNQAPGENSFTWNGLSSSGDRIPGGIYFYRVHTDKYFVSKKMLLIR